MGRKLKDPTTDVWIHPIVIWMWDAIKNSGLTHYMVSEKSGIATSTMRKWMRGESAPKLEDIEAVINALGGVLTVKPEPKTFIDPPDGWRYGFPKPIPKSELDRVGDWLIENGYPKAIMDSFGTKFIYRTWIE